MASQFGVTLEVKEFFFDRDVVKRLVGKKNASALYRMGRNIRQRARRSMKLRGYARKPPTTDRMRKKQAREIREQPASPPGSPPYAHSGDPVATLRNILYAFSPRSISTVVGPLRLNQTQSLNGRVSAGTIPALHEFGGTAQIKEKRVGRSWAPQGRRKPRPGQPTRLRTAKYPARPFMAPALAKEAPKFPTIYARSA